MPKTVAIVALCRTLEDIEAGSLKRMKNYELGALVLTSTRKKNAVENHFNPTQCTVNDSGMDLPENKTKICTRPKN